eukprot:c15033_g1_i3.p1 GENE.c15033_g1_i3~~c15033_g1_i3.p1  ORF type:complete len:269 (-),score=38.68 c15033_g1_i3:60-812(-)
MDLCGVFCVPALLAFALKYIIIPRTSYPKRLIVGADDWTCYLSIVFQFGVYWVLATLGWWEAGFSWSWLVSSVHNLPSSGFYERLLMQAFVFHLLKDPWDLQKPCLRMLFLHHLLCLIYIVVAHFMPSGFGAVVLDIAILEFASGAFNVEMCKPGSFTTMYFIIVSIGTLSNVVLLPLWELAAFEVNASLSYHAFFIVATTILNFCRQRLCFEHCAQIWIKQGEQIEAETQESATTKLLNDSAKSRPSLL